MDKKVLVTYASSYGATREIAEKIGAVLCESGLQADVVPVKSVNGLSAYRAVVLGSGLYVGNWLKEGAAFLKANEQTLAGMPVWIFSSGPTGEGDPLKLLDGVRLPAALQPIADRIQPRDVTVFHGFIDPHKIGFISRFAVKNVVKKPFGDFRDWNAITAWAKLIAEALREAQPA